MISTYDQRSNTYDDQTKTEHHRPEHHHARNAMNDDHRTNGGDLY
jgi:hypothetical protein